MPSLQSLLLAAVLAHVPATFASPMIIRPGPAFTARPLGGDVDGSMPGNVTWFTGNSTVSADPSTISATVSGAPVASLRHRPTTTTSTKPTYTPPPPPNFYNLGNITCKDLTAMSPVEIWASTKISVVITNMTNTYSHNYAICPECNGIPTDQCHSTNPSCKTGLRDLSKNGGDTPRWDTAAARWAGDGDLTDMKCGIGNNVCSGTPTCSSANGPGAFAFLKSLTTLSHSLNNYYNAIESARDFAQTQMTQFSSVFAPIPQPADNTFSDLFMSIAGGLIGFIPGVGGEIAGVLNDVGGQLIDSVKQATPSSPADTSSMLGLITDGTLKVWADFADQIFSKGTYQGSSGAKHTVAFSDLTAGGKLLADANATDFATLEPLFRRLLFQQLAVYTWRNLELDDHTHMPFIAFDPAPCDKVDKDNSVIAGVAALDAGVTHKGACYYLLDALPVDAPRNGAIDRPTGGPKIKICGGGQTLPGGTNKALSDNAALFSGLTLADFIVPAVEGWLANKKQNGFSTIGDKGDLMRDPQAAGAVAIPVCDYPKGGDKGGTGCPILNGAVSGNGCYVQ